MTLSWPTQTPGLPTCRPRPRHSDCPTHLQHQSRPPPAPLLSTRLAATAACPPVTQPLAFKQPRAQQQHSPGLESPAASPRTPVRTAEARVSPSRRPQEQRHGCCGHAASGQQVPVGLQRGAPRHQAARAAGQIWRQDQEALWLRPRHRLAGAPPARGCRGLCSSTCQPRTVCWNLPALLEPERGVSGGPGRQFAAVEGQRRRLSAPTRRAAGAAAAAAAAHSASFCRCFVCRWWAWCLPSL
jgi:hypothetical protein